MLKLATIQDEVYLAICSMWDFNLITTKENPRLLTNRRSFIVYLFMPADVSNSLKCSLHNDAHRGEARRSTFNNLEVESQVCQLVLKTKLKLIFNFL